MEEAIASILWAAPRLRAEVRPTLSFSVLHTYNGNRMEKRWLSG